MICTITGRVLGIVPDKKNPSLGKVHLYQESKGELVKVVKFPLEKQSELTAVQTFVCDSFVFVPSDGRPVLVNSFKELA